MSLKIGNRIQQTSTTTGTSDFQLIDPDATRSAIDSLGTGQEVTYLAEDETRTNWEYGRGTITTGTPDSLSRTTILQSSTGSKISFLAGTKTIYVLIPAQMMLWAGASDAWGFTDIASAATTNIGSVNTIGANITGTTNITSLGTHANTFRLIKFAGVLSLVHQGTSLILAGAANRSTAAGDVAAFMSDASGNWREIFYVKAVGVPGFIANRGGTNQTGLAASSLNTISFNNVVRNDGAYYDGVTNFRFSPPPGVYRATVSARAVLGTSNASHSVLISKNGSGVAESSSFAASMLGATGSVTMQVTQDIVMATGDFLSALVSLPAGITAISGAETHTFFSAYKIRD